jgi:hypothetical protein
VGERPEIQERHAAVGLRVEIDQQRRLAPQREGRGQVHGGGGLADPTFLVCDGDDHQA